IAALLTPIIGGIIIFSEWDGLNPGILAAKIIAIVLVLIGVILLSLHSSRSKSGIEIDEESEEVAEEKEEDVYFRYFLEYYLIQCLILAWGFRRKEQQIYLKLKDNLWVKI
ncbi:MAG: hypothetical protein ACTSP5_15045, partial [Candidatus Heimdallarchaeota archaeon]